MVGRKPFCMGFFRKLLQKFGSNPFCYFLAFQYSSISAEKGSFGRKYLLYCACGLFPQNETPFFEIKACFPQSGPVFPQSDVCYYTMKNLEAAEKAISAESEMVYLFTNVVSTKLFLITNIPHAEARISRAITSVFSRASKACAIISDAKTRSLLSFGVLPHWPVGRRRGIWKASISQSTAEWLGYRCHGESPRARRANHRGRQFDGIQICLKITSMTL